MTPREMWAESVPPFCQGCGNRVTEYGNPPVFRVASTTSGPVVELADGKDSLGETRWVKALLVPDRRGLGEPVYEGWRAISEALGVTPNAAMSYARAKDHALPVRYSHKGTPFILRALLRAWVTDRSYGKEARTHRRTKRVARG